MERKAGKPEREREREKKLEGRVSISTCLTPLIKNEEDINNNHERRLIVLAKA